LAPVLAPAQLALREAAERHAAGTGHPPDETHRMDGTEDARALAAADRRPSRGLAAT